MHSTESDRFYYQSIHAQSILAGRKPFHNRFWLRIASRLVDGGKWLDVGCGLGDLLRDVGRRFAGVGMDIRRFATHQAKVVANDSAVVQASSQALPFGTKIFNVISALDVLEHLDAPESAISECHRVLRPRGVLLIRVPNTASIGRQLKRHRWFGYRDATHVSLLSPHGWQKIISACGFQITTVMYDGLWDPPYLRLIPTIFQAAFFKPLSALLFWSGFKGSSRFGENLCIVAIKDGGKSGSL